MKPAADQTQQDADHQTANDGYIYSDRPPLKGNVTRQQPARLVPMDLEPPNYGTHDRKNQPCDHHASSNSHF